MLVGYIHALCLRDDLGGDALGFRFHGDSIRFGEAATPPPPMENPRRAVASGRCRICSGWNLELVLQGGEGRQLLGNCLRQSQAGAAVSALILAERL